MVDKACKGFWFSKLEYSTRNAIYELRFPGKQKNRPHDYIITRD